MNILVGFVNWSVWLMENANNMYIAIIFYIVPILNIAIELERRRRYSVVQS